MGEGGMEHLGYEYDGAVQRELASLRTQLDQEQRGYDNLTGMYLAALRDIELLKKGETSMKKSTDLVKCRVCDKAIDPDLVIISLHDGSKYWLCDEHAMRVFTLLVGEEAAATMNKDLK
jgi:hypothetical protein